MFLAYRKDRKLDGNNPVYLYGYGGFKLSYTPQFSATAAWWVEHGGIYALVNLRGGSEFGEEWHQNGMLLKKQNVFDDFTGAAEWLVANKYTNPKKIAIVGGSNGGLLVGAAMTQRPDLFGAVLCQVPLLDSGPLPSVQSGAILGARVWFIRGPGSVCLYSEVLAVSQPEKGHKIPRDHVRYG
jgi:prolyl oligopeptidase